MDGQLSHWSQQESTKLHKHSQFISVEPKKFIAYTKSQSGHEQMFTNIHKCFHRFRDKEHAHKRRFRIIHQTIARWCNYFPCFWSLIVCTATRKRSRMHISYYYSNANVDIRCSKVLKDKGTFFTPIVPKILNS